MLFFYQKVKSPISIYYLYIQFISFLPHIYVFYSISMRNLIWLNFRILEMMWIENLRKHQIISYYWFMVSEVMRHYYLFEKTWCVHETGVSPKRGRPLMLCHITTPSSFSNSTLQPIQTIELCFHQYIIQKLSSLWKRITIMAEVSMGLDLPYWATLPI